MIVVAHRGASAYAPENTLAALEAAPRLGAHMAEIDVRRTADGELVVVHDPTLARTTDAALRFPGRRPWRVQDFTLAEIRSLDAGYWFSDRYAGQRVPTLGEALDVLRQHGCGALVELKVQRRDPLLGSRVLEFLARDPYWRGARRDGTLMLQSFDWVVLRALTESLPGLCTAALGRPYGRIGLRRLARYARQVHPHHLRVTAPYVRQVHDQGMGMFGWTVNHPGAIRRLVRDGVDGIITDYPDRVAGEALLAA
ncbi:glycerophosphodiester phosphodiesterase [Nocardiopsis chromatogenes]|uniref:glycerophosphodiester phosphodiesterase n=1 Tax=Nocardiopsis chromatogenes TaxID=280239 RepID=UPI00034BE03C|nr:glycerophosphodiester phosphodiesterase family protein [Nocardiopsis chromatogenes]